MAKKNANDFFRIDTNFQYFNNLYSFDDNKLSRWIKVNEVKPELCSQLDGQCHRQGYFHHHAFLQATKFKNELFKSTASCF